MPRIRLPHIRIDMGRLSATHVMVVAYSMLLIGFAVVVFMVWNEG